MRVSWKWGAAALGVALLAACSRSPLAGTTGGQAALPAAGQAAATSTDRQVQRFGILGAENLCDCGEFSTRTIGGWGAEPHGYNAGTILANNFGTIAPLIVGTGNTLRFDSAAEVAAFLPSGTTPGVLDQSHDPPTGVTSAGVFASQVTALKINTLLDDVLAPNPSGELTDVELLSGPFAGYTVGELLTLAEAVLGGDTGALPPGTTVSNLNDAVDGVNNAFKSGPLAPDGITYRCAFPTF